MNERRLGKTRYWTDERIERAILEVVRSLQINYMPSSAQVKEVTQDESLHNAICRHGSYRGWAKRLGLNNKKSETNTGNDYEEYIERILLDLGFEVEQMSTKHPYDLLVNGTTKVDVKVGSSYMLRDEHRVVTFATNKKQPTCDFYICVRLDEQKQVEKIHVIPSQMAQVTTLCFGEVSKYDVYINRYDLLRRHYELMQKLYYELCPTKE